MTRIYVPIDSAALALGAQGVAEAIASEAEKRGIDVQLVRNGSRGLFYLEPLVEVETADGRIGYSNVEADDVAALFDAGFHEGKAHEKNVGVVDEIPYLKNQQRLTFARIGITDPLSIDDYTALGGLEGLRQVLDMNGDAVCQALLDSGLRGRGGAAFPAGIKWKTVAGTAAAQKYVVCNADEGDSGTFSDRMTMEGDPFVLIEGNRRAANFLQTFIDYPPSQLPASFTIDQVVVDVKEKVKEAMKKAQPPAAATPTQK